MSRPLVIVALLASVTIPGSVLAAWQPGGNVVCAAPGQKYDLAMVSDGSDGVYCAWTDHRGAASQVYLQHVDGAGNTLWQVDGLPVSPLIPDGTYPLLASDNAGGVFVLWSEDHFWVMRVSATGEFLWPEPVAVRPPGTAARWARIVPDGTGGVIIAWQDRSVPGEYGVFMQHLDASGIRLWGDAGLRVSDYEADPELVSDGSDGAFVTWSDWRAGVHSDVYVQHVAGDGTVHWVVNGIRVTWQSNNQAYPQVVSDSAGGVIVTWLDILLDPDFLRAQRISPSGTALWPAVGVTVGEHGWWYYAVGDDGSGGMIAAWQGGPLNRKVRVQRVNALGEQLWSPEGAAVADSPASQVLPVMITSHEGSALIAWQDQRNGGCIGIYAQKLLSTGIRTWDSDGVVVTDRDGNQYSPRIIKGGTEEMLAFWRHPSAAADTLFLMPVGSTTTGLIEECTLPPISVPDATTATLLLESSPNPFNPRTELTFTLPRDGHVKLILHDTLGRRIATLVDGWFPAGDHRITWEGRDSNSVAAPAGVYLASLRQGDACVTKKIALIR